MPRRNANLLIALLALSVSVVFAAVANAAEDGPDYQLAQSPYAGDYDDEGEGSGGGRGKFAGMLLEGGAVFLDVDGLNSDLKDWGYPEFDSDFVSLGFELFWRHRFVRTDLMVPFMLRQRASNSRYQSALTGGALIWHFGVDVVPHPVVNVVPLIGLGYGWMDLSHKQRRENSIEGAHLGTARVLHLTAHNFVLDGGLALEFAFPTHLIEGKEEHFNLMLRGGYLYTPIRADWRNGSFNMSGGPEFAMTGPYILFGVGGDSESFD